MAEQDALPLEDEKNEPTEPKKVEISETDLTELKDRAAALETRLQAAEIEKAKLEERAGAPEVKEPESPPRLTFEQLQNYVDSGQITQVQADAEKARQMREDIKAEVSTELEAKFSAREQKNVLQTEFDGYMKMRPDLSTEGTDDRKRFQEEYNTLLRLGHPHDLRTEVAAMHVVFGSLDRIEETTRRRRESHRETGGAGAGAERLSAEKGWKKDLTSNQISIYEDQVAKGAYRGFDDPMFLRVTNRARTQNQQRKTA